MPYILFAYREVPQTTTGFSPFEILYGREVRGPLDILKEEWEASERSNESVVSHILRIRERMEMVQELVQENVKEAQKRQKKWYDRAAREVELKANDKVLVLLPTSTNKLLAQWRGPFTVVQKTGKVNYLIRTTRNKTKTYHVNMLKKWYEAEEASFLQEEPQFGDTEDSDELAGWMDRSDNTP